MKKRRFSYVLSSKINFYLIVQCKKLVGHRNFLLLFSESVHQLRYELVKIIEKVFTLLTCVISYKTIKANSRYYRFLPKIFSYCRY